MKLVFSTVLLSLLVGLSLQQDTQRDVCTSPACQRLASYFQSTMNQSANPCDHFYKFACGQHAENAVIPSYYQEAVSFQAIQDSIDMILEALLENDYNPQGAKSFVQPMKDFYNSCMRSASVANDGNDDLVNILRSAYIHTDFSGFDPLESSIQITSNGIFADFLLDVHVARDPTNSSQYVFTAKPHLGGLIDDVYYKQGMENEVVKAEHAAMVKIAVILGFDEATAKSTMTKVQQMRVTLANTEAFNDATNKRMTFGEFEAMVPTVSYGALFKSLLNRPIQNDEPIVVHAPAYLNELAKVLANEDQQTLAFQLFSTSINMLLPYLSNEIRTASLELYKVWYGVTALKPRKIVCVTAVAKDFDVALSNYYIRSLNRPQRKANVEEMSRYVMDEMLNTISESKVFSDNAKAAASKKARAMKKFIAYPEQYINDNVVSEHYRSLKYEYTGNYLNKALTLFKHRFAKRFANLDQENGDDFSSFGDATEVSSDYIGSINALRVTFAFFHEPFYTDNGPTAINFAFAAISFGHEIAQGFSTDYINRDAYGNENSFMDAQSTENYNNNAKCVEDYFGKLSLDGMQVDGKRTLDENIADIEGVRMGFKAYRKYASDKKLTAQALPNLPYSDEQMYFISVTNVFCSRKRPEYFKHFMLTDPHAPRQYRAEGVVSHNKEFAEVFNCPAASPMNPTDKCVMF